MAELSYLLQKTCNKLLDFINDSIATNTALPSVLALSHEFNVSRTSIRTAIEHLCQQNILTRTGNSKIILRKPLAKDYFDISNESSTKEEQFEKFFLSLINAGKLLPGDRFSELDLAKKSNCITITVREFLIKFSHTGLIQKKPRSQWQMVEFDEQFALELVSFRKILEMASIRALFELPVEAAIWEEIELLLIDHQALRNDFDNKYNDFPALDSRLHHTIQRCSGNRFVSQFFNVVTFICHYHYQWDKSDEKERNAIAVEEHIELLNKLLTRDMNGAIISLEKHLNTAQKTLMRSAHGLI